MIAGKTFVLIAVFLTASFTESMCGAIDLPADANEAVFTQALVLPRTGRGGRAATHTDALEHRLVEGQWSGVGVEAGDQLERADGTAIAWESADAAENGWLQHQALRGGYALVIVNSAIDRVMVLDARGHSLVAVNGAPRAGDPYSTGFLQVPVALKTGANEFLFRVGRGRLMAKLVDPPGDVSLMGGDLTTADIVRGERWAVPGGIKIMNASSAPRDDLRIVTSADVLPVHETRVPSIGPMTTRKVAFWTGGDIPPGVRSVSVRVRLIDGEQRVLDEREVRLGVRDADEKHKRTFVSEIDGSVQYFAVTPMPAAAAEGVEHPALFLSLHGASVEATNQAFSYGRKDWGVVVAPTNRRPFGFDWEDWGRLDALEVLEIGERLYSPDPNRIYLTGHSMGGHGTWQLGAHFPDRFAAIGPSAGWRSFASYGGASSLEEADPVEDILKRAASASDTLLLSRNYLHHGVYILHGDKDDNVPVAQARFMKEHLDAFHDDLGYHEQPGAGHWWGNQCMDWPAMFDFFKARARPAAVDRIEYRTVNPGISDRSRWVRIDAQVRSLAVSRIVAEVDRDVRAIDCETTNVSRLRVDVEEAMGVGAVSLSVDGQSVAVEGDEVSVVWLERSGDTWGLSEAPAADVKNARRNGPFKDAFRHRMMFVYATQGTQAERDWAYEKARYDAETFYYRGNGAVDVVADIDFDPAAQPNRGVIVYGNAETNAAWEALLGDSPVQVMRDRVEIGDRAEHGGNLSCLFIRPRPGSDVACVGVVAGTGAVGNRLTERIPYFVSGVAFPDCTVLSSEMLTTGTQGVRVAGYFGVDWSVERGEFAWRANEDR